MSELDIFDDDDDYIVNLIPNSLTQCSSASSGQLSSSDVSQSNNHLTMFEEDKISASADNQLENLSADAERGSAKRKSGNDVNLVKKMKGSSPSKTLTNEHNSSDIVLSMEDEVEEFDDGSEDDNISLLIGNGDAYPLLEEEKEPLSVQFKICSGREIIIKNLDIANKIFQQDDLALIPVKCDDEEL